MDRMNNNSGLVAQELLDEKTRIKIAELGYLKEFNNELEHACNWADVVKKDSTLDYEWSQELHYVLTKDEPPYCNYVDERDCKDHRCVVGAISNYTQILRQKYPPHSYSVQTEAVKFLIHFIGDITQPMHVTGYQFNGLDEFAKFKGKESNLHKFWDNEFVEERVQEVGKGDILVYRDYLVQHYQKGHYFDDSDAWTHGIESTATDPQSGVWLTAIEWIKDTKITECEFWADYDVSMSGRPRSPTSGGHRRSSMSSVSMNSPTTTLLDLHESGVYDKYRHAIDQQLAKAGVRMAKLLNLLFE